MKLIKLAALFSAAQAILMELSALILFVGVIAVGSDLGFMDGHPIFSMKYLQDNLELMMIMAGIFGALRLVGAVGLWKNRMWGFYLSLIMCIVTLVLMIFMLPAGIADGLLSGAALVCMLIAHSGTKTILPASR